MVKIEMQDKSIARTMRMISYFAPFASWNDSFFICPHLISTIEHNFVFQSWDMSKTRSMTVMISYFAPSASRNDPLPSWPTIGTNSPDSGIGRWKWWWFAAVADCNTESSIANIANLVKMLPGPVKKGCNSDIVIKHLDAAPVFLVGRAHTFHLSYLYASARWGLEKVCQKVHKCRLEKWQTKAMVGPHKKRVFRFLYFFCK